MTKIRVTLVRSSIGRPANHKRVLESLGLRKMNHSVEHENTPSILGMCEKVKHLIKVEEI